MAGRVLIKGGGPFPTHLANTDEMAQALADMLLAAARSIIKKRDEERARENEHSLSRFAAGETRTAEADALDRQRRDHRVYGDVDYLLPGEPGINNNWEG